MKIEPQINNISTEPEKKSASNEQVLNIFL